MPPGTGEAQRPGVPEELETMFRNLVSPRLRRHFPALVKSPFLIARVVGLPESEVVKRLGKNFFRGPFEVGVYPGIGETLVRIRAERAAAALPWATL